MANKYFVEFERRLVLEYTQIRQFIEVVFSDGADVAFVDWLLAELECLCAVIRGQSPAFFHHELEVEAGFAAQMKMWSQHLVRHVEEFRDDDEMLERG